MDRRHAAEREPLASALLAVCDQLDAVTGRSRRDDEDDEDDEDGW